jgi:hypothetical protein
MIYKSVDWRVIALALGAPFLMGAYIDPGTGYLLLQLIIAAVLGSFIFARQQMGRLKRWVAGLVGKGPTKDRDEIG